MSEQEMIEALAAAEHASWARWMAYLFSKSPFNPAGHRVIPEGLVRHWQRQIDTSYADLTEREKQSDRNEVAHILPIINSRIAALEAENARLRAAGDNMAGVVRSLQRYIVRDKTQMLREDAFFDNLEAGLAASAAGNAALAEWAALAASAGEG